MRIYVDFDGVLFRLGKFPGVGEVVAGAPEAMRALKAAGHHLVIFSTRSNIFINKPSTRKVLMAAMARALREYGIPFDEIANYKPAWDVLIDDRCVAFNGSWFDAILRVANFEPVDWSPADGITDHTYYKKDGHGKKEKQ